MSSPVTPSLRPKGQLSLDLLRARLRGEGSGCGTGLGGRRPPAGGGQPRRHAGAERVRRKRGSPAALAGRGSGADNAPGGFARSCRMGLRSTAAGLRRHQRSSLPAGARTDVAGSRRAAHRSPHLWVKRRHGQQPDFGRASGHGPVLGHSQHCRTAGWVPVGASPSTSPTCCAGDCPDGHHPPDRRGLPWPGRLVTMGVGRPLLQVRTQR